MPIDFSKITFPLERFHYTHNCSKCNVKVILVADLTGKRHYPELSNCFGTLSMISKKKVA